MITEDYVSFETAKLLKEKRFNENCAALYDLRNGEFREKQTGYVFNNNQWDNFIIAPTLQMALKWLREVHFLFIDIDPLSGYRWAWSIWLMNDSYQKMGESLDVFSTYKEAAEAAIKYCLENLI